jgi:hypothetical protein
MATLKNVVFDDTGSLTLPVGTELQRPSPTLGMMRYSTTSNKVENYNEQDDWAGPITAGLRVHLDASNTTSYSGSGSTWSDISSNGYNFTWNSTPRYLADTKRSWFECLGNIARGPASNGIGITDTSGNTIIMISRTGDSNNETPGFNTAANSGFKFYNTTGTGGATRGIFTHPAWSNGTGIFFDQGGCCGDSQRVSVFNSQLSGLTASIHTWTMWGFRSTVGTRSIYRNGREIAGSSVQSPNLNLSSTAIDLGGSDEYGGVQSVWDAKLNLFLVYNRGLTDNEMFRLFKQYKSRLDV